MQKLRTKRKGYLLPAALQCVMVLLFAAETVLTSRIGLRGVTPRTAATVSMDMLLTALVTLLFFACLCGKNMGRVMRLFLRMLFLAALYCFCDIMVWLLAGRVRWNLPNLLFNTAFLSIASVLVWTLWRLVRIRSGRESRHLKRLERTLFGILALEHLFLTANLFFGFWFGITPDGFYETRPGYALYVLLMFGVVTVFFLGTRELQLRLRDRILTVLYPLVPFIGLAIGLLLPDCVALDCPMFCLTLLFIYAEFYVRNEREAGQSRAEMELAASIQNGVLPHGLPLGDVQLFTEIRPARSVGGDFYDYFPVGEGRLAFLIGDVSGKGVPSALFMMTAKTLFESCAQYETEPAALMTRVNEALCRNNEADLFVTAWLGILDCTAGRLSCCCAGHNPPLIRENGVWRFLRGAHGCMLGYVPQATYQQEEYVLAPADGIFLYTDGVTEAKAPDSEMYGEERLLSFFNAHSDLAPKELSAALLRDVEAFAAGAEQFDDITVLMLKRPADA